MSQKKWGNSWSNFTLTMHQRNVSISRLNVKIITIHAELALICEIKNSASGLYVQVILIPSAR